MELFYRRLGKGKPLILLHGLMEMSDTWLPIARALARRFDVILPDLRNHGQSPHSNDFSLRAMAQDIIELMDTLQIRSAYLVGYSMGGRVAMNLTQNHPDRVKRLVVIDMAPDKYPPQQIIQHGYLEKLNRILQLDLGQFTRRTEISEQLSQILGNSPLINLFQKNIRRTKQGFRWKFNPKAIHEYINTLRDYPIDIQRSIHTPTIFIRASKSPYINKQQIELIKRIFTNCRIKTIRNTTHFLPVERPKKLAIIITLFLKWKI